MGCFIVPTIVGIGVYAARKKLPAWLHCEWLFAMTIGGAVGLTVEHIAHGEIVPWPPFFTAASNPQQLAVLLDELLYVGVPMAIALVLAWLTLVVAYNIFSSKKPVKQFVGS
ncbi:MAG: hypothetical protein N3G80_01620 [Candidatus Micrarchaeota archaeon]|nr:hypothetical protein [Candidatus Micrarchaeota archaeon]